MSSPSTQLALLGGEPIVVVADPQSGELIAAYRQGGAWTTEVVATEVSGGASISATGDTAAISFYTGSGLSVLTGGPGSWSQAASIDAQGSGHHGRDPGRFRRGRRRLGNDLGDLAGRRRHPSRFRRRRGRDRGGRAAGHERRRDPHGGDHGGRLLGLPRVVRHRERRSPAGHLRGDLRPQDRGSEPGAAGSRDTGRGRRMR